VTEYGKTLSNNSKYVPNDEKFAIDDGSISMKLFSDRSSSTRFFQAPVGVDKKPRPESRFLLSLSRRRLLSWRYSMGMVPLRFDPLMSRISNVAEELKFAGS